jgi:hypothetical protein
MDQIYNLLANVWATIAARLFPEMYKGIPYVMRSTIASLTASTSNQQVPTNDFTNGTDMDYVVTSFRFEMAPQAATGIFATGGGAGSWLGLNDYYVKAHITEVKRNQELMAAATEIGLLIHPVDRRWVPACPLIVPPNGILNIKLDNTSSSAITNVLIEAEGYLRPHLA